MNGDADTKIRLAEYSADAFLRVAMGSLSLFPYERRVPMAGALMSSSVGPLVGFGSRIKSNLDFVLPELSQSERKRIYKGCLDNFGRLYAELFSPDQFKSRAVNWIPEGDGLDTLESAARLKTPVILIGAHFGNYEAARASLIGSGISVGGLYRPMNNRFFNRRYVEAMKRLGQSVFPKGRRGLKGLMSYIRSGGIAVILNDQYALDGVEFRFMGQTAKTSVDPAKIAMRCGAHFIPFYGIRKSNGVDFKVCFEKPIEAGDPVAMTRSYNESLERRIREHPEQWFWIHRRWK